MGYVELHARSAFSFLRGGSSPELLAQVAAHAGLPAIALCDRNGVYGAVRLHMTAKDVGLRALVGCDLAMEDGTVLPVLVANQAGYRRLSTLLTHMHLGSEKDQGRVRWHELEDTTGLIALTGDEDGPVRQAWRSRGNGAATAAAEQLLRLFGRDRLYVEVQRHLVPGEAYENEFLVDWARARRVPLLATNGVLHATPKERTVLDIFTCLRLHTTLDRAGRQLSANAERHVKDEAQMRALFYDLPEAVDNTVALAERLDFTLTNLGYRFPDYPVGPGENQEEFLRARTYEGARKHYPAIEGPVKHQLDRELALITQLGFAGYFLIVWDICRFARDQGILVQGRGSAANSAVCYSLGITAVDPIREKLLFERFLSEGRTDWPDIDIDLPSGPGRETVIQKVYAQYGRLGSAMTANVITYRGRSTMREVGKVLGFPDDALDRFSALFHGGDYPQTLELRDQLKLAGVSMDHPRLPMLVQTCQQVHGLPRHLSQHSGGMVLSAGNLSDYVPLENARMPQRSVLQWDKSDCEDMGIVKIDLLGLGMMAVLQDSLRICTERGEPVDLATLDKADAPTYELMQRADTVGLFQIESRAQMSTLPRMKPERFYDLVVEVAIIRPGPIQGDAVNPYLARRAGAPVVYPDPRAEPILKRTLGVVLFQEQVLRLAMELGGFSAAEADELRRAIGFTRTPERMNKMKDKLAGSLAQNGVAPAAVTSIITALSSFALYGFPESHAISFALIAYASAWLKVHRRAAFYAGLLNNQPMGFYSPASLVQDAQRHDVRTLPVCIQESFEDCRVIDEATIRLGFNSIHGLRDKPLAAMLAARAERPFASTDDFFKRTRFSAAERRILSGAGALNVLAGHRRAALWQAEAMQSGDELFRFAAAEAKEAAAPLARMTYLERIQADYALVGLTTGRHPMSLLRDQLPGVLAAAALKDVKPRTRVTIGGSVITRQRPGTAKGVCFITLEDETGHANAIVRPALFEEYRLVINLEPALIITGRLQNAEGVIHIMAEVIAAMPALGLPPQASHDYH